MILTGPTPIQISPPSQTVATTAISRILIDLDTATFTVVFGQRHLTGTLDAATLAGLQALLQTAAETDQGWAKGTGKLAPPPPPPVQAVVAKPVAVAPVPAPAPKPVA